VAEGDALRNPTKVAKRLFGILEADLPRLNRIDRYIRGEHDDPYMPDNANQEYQLLAERCVTNHCPLLINAPAQVLSVDGYRRGNHSVKSTSEKTLKIALRGNLPEWDHWEQSRLPARQDAVHRAAIGYGHAFTVTEMVKGEVMTRGLSPLRTTALFDDPANDDDARAVLHIETWPRMVGKVMEPGTAILWDRTFKYTYRFRDKDKWSLKEAKRHGLKGKNPVTRFAAQVDLDGRTLGVVEPYLSIQDRINQTVFDLLVAQTGASFRVRWVTGMAPPILMTYPLDEEGNPDFSEKPVPKLDANGQRIPLPININAKKMMFAEDEDVKFGNFDITPLAPYLEAIQQAIKDLSSVTQTPPHYMLGQIANLSADAMKAAEKALTRKANAFKLVFGESWERVFRIALELLGDSAHEDYTGEVIWRDLEASSLNQAADAYGKMAESLGIPKRGIWPMLPGITQNQLVEWENLLEEEGDLSTVRNGARDALNQMMERDNGDTTDDSGDEDSG